MPAATVRIANSCCLTERLADSQTAGLPDCRTARLLNEIQAEALMMIPETSGPHALSQPHSLAVSLAIPDSRCRGLRLFIVNTRQLLKDKFICTHAYDAGFESGLAFCDLALRSLATVLCFWDSVRRRRGQVLSIMQTHLDLSSKLGRAAAAAAAAAEALIEVRPRRLIGVKCR